MSSTSSKSPFAQNKKSKGSIFRYIALFGLLALIIVAFVVSPAIASFAGGGSQTFGKFGNQLIRYQQGNYFYNSVAAYNNQNRDFLTQNPDFFEIMRQNIWMNAFNDTVGFIAKKYYMIKSGYQISEKAMNRIVVESGYYNNRDGKFDSQTYSQTSNGDKERIRRSLADDAYGRQYYEDILGGALQNDNFIEFVGSVSPDERKIEYISFSQSEYPSDLVLEKGEEFSRFFQSRDLSKMTFETEKEATRVTNEITNGVTTFEDAAMTYSQDIYAAEGGKLNNRYFYQISDELDEETADMVFMLATGSLSAPLETPYGWYVYQADSDVSELDLEDQTIEQTIRGWLTRNRGDIIDQWIQEETENFISTLGDDDNAFALAAIRAGKSLQETGYFTLNWGGSPMVGSTITNASPDTTLQSASKSDDFYKTVFGLEKGEISEPVSIGNSTLLVRVTDIRESESRISNYDIRYYLQYYREQLWGEMALESELFQNNFSQVYGEFFPPSTSTDSES